MLGFIYYPVSFVLWCWHGMFGLLLGDASAVGWALSVVLLVVTVRVILLRPAIGQARTMRAMQRLAPKIRAIQRKHADDRQRQSAELQRLQREHGVNPLAGCLPALLQIPAFIGLSRVLRVFTEYPNRSNYFFPNSDVRSYLAAKLFGAHLGDALFHVTALSGPIAAHSPWLWQVAPVVIPLILVSAVATHVNARLSTQPADTAQAALSRVLSMWVFPLGMLVFGAALPLGWLIYVVTNNCWTLGQQYLLLRHLDREDARREAERPTGERHRVRH